VEVRFPEEFGWRAAITTRTVISKIHAALTTMADTAIHKPLPTAFVARRLIRPRIRPTIAGIPQMNPERENIKAVIAVVGVFLTVSESIVRRSSPEVPSTEWKAQFSSSNACTAESFPPRLS